MSQAKISKLPSHLVVQIARMYFKVDIQQKAKILRAVTFSNALDVYEFCSDEYKKVLDKGRKLTKAIEMNVDEVFEMDSDPDAYITGHYELVSVLTHKGRSADSGHYTAWAKNFIMDGEKTKKPVDSWTLLA